MMISDDFLSFMLQCLRVKETDLSLDEVTGLVYAALSDLKRQGVEKIDLDDPLTQQAVKLYCKAHYGYDSNADRFLKCYEALAASMALDVTDYKGGDSDG